jgi:hypothetical protein
MNVSGAVRLFGLGVVVTGLLVACQTPDPEPKYPDLSYAHYGAIPLDVARIEVVRAYTQPAKKPNVEHLFPVNPMASAESWVKDRLRAAGRSGVAQATISSASVVEVPLKRSTGVRGVFTKDQAERYDGLIEMTVRILGDDGQEKASVRSRAERSRTVAEDVSLIEREKTWFEMTEAMMNDLNASLQRQINEHLRSFVR